MGSCTITTVPSIGQTVRQKGSNNDRRGSFQPIGPDRDGSGPNVAVDDLGRSNAKLVERRVVLPARLANTGGLSHEPPRCARRSSSSSLIGRFSQ